MNKKKVTGLRIFSTTLLSSALALSLTTCASKEKAEIKYPTIEESFYDDNETGLDDRYEQLVDNSEEDINELTKIEKIVDLIYRIKDIDKGISFNNDNEYLYIYTDNEMFSSEDLSSIEEYLDQVKDYSEMPQEEKYEIHSNLENIYHKMIGYLRNYAPKHMKKSLLDLTKVVGVDSIGIDSIDDIRVYIDNYNSHDGWYIYNNGEEEKEYSFDSSTSDIYDLVEDYLYYDCNENVFATTFTTEEQIDNLLSRYKTSLIRMANVMENEYEVENELFKDNPIVKKK